jgi:hypothetical protein
MNLVQVVGDRASWGPWVFLESRMWMVEGQEATSTQSPSPPLLSLVTGSVRIEVTDTRTEPLPPAPGAVRQPELLDESGRGLAVVEALADRWEVVERVPPPGKTVRVEIDLPRWLALVRGLDRDSGSVQVGAGGWSVCTDTDPTPPKPSAAVAGS